MELSLPMLAGQLLIGLINGAAYAMLSLGLAVIFGILNIINVTHGAQYMMGAFCAWFLLHHLGIGYWWALLIVPVVIGASGILLERLFLWRTYKLDHLYGFLLTFGLSLVIEGAFRQAYGTSGQPYDIPEALQGGQDLDFLYLPNYRIWVITLSATVCLGTWFLIERTRLGTRLRAATENAPLVQAFGINVPRLVTLTYGFGVGLAGLAGVMVAPIYQVGALMGSSIISVVFAVVVIGGLSSIFGAIVSGFLVGIVEGLTRVFWPQASSTAVFIIMVIVLLTKPAGLFGTVMPPAGGRTVDVPVPRAGLARGTTIALLALALAAPFLFYPIFLMKALCYALFAAAFGLLIGYAGLMSFGHAAYFGGAAHVAAHHEGLGACPELACSPAPPSPLLGLFFGWVAIRRQGIYFAMVTFALAQIVYFYAVQALDPRRGRHPGRPRGTLFGLFDLSRDLTLYYAVLAIFLAGYFIHRAIHSPFGQVLKAIRENEARATSLGYMADLASSSPSSSPPLTGLAGSTKCLVSSSPRSPTSNGSCPARSLLMTLVGGLGTSSARSSAPSSSSRWKTTSPNTAPGSPSSKASSSPLRLTFRRGLVGETLTPAPPRGVRAGGG